MLVVTTAISDIVDIIVLQRQGFIVFGYLGVSALAAFTAFGVVCVVDVITIVAIARGEIVPVVGRFARFATRFATRFARLGIDLLDLPDLELLLSDLVLLPVLRTQHHTCPSRRH